MLASNFMRDEGNFANQDVGETMNDSMANASMGEDREKVNRRFNKKYNNISLIQNSSETVEVKKKRRSARNMSKLKIADCESLDHSDDDSGPLTKKSKAESLKMKNKVSKLSVK